MAEGIITRRGGGAGKQPFALIQAAFPSGICTCTNGVISFTATSSPAMFTIPEAGTWTVTAVDGDDTAAESVEINSAGQIEHITLLYELILWEAGNNNTEVTGGWNLGYLQTAEPYSAASDSVLRVGGYTSNAASGQYLGTKNKIDFTPYKTLRVAISAHSGQRLTLGPSNASGANGNFYAKIEPTTKGTFDLDVSKINASYYLNMDHGNNSVSLAYVRFSSIKLI